MTVGARYKQLNFIPTLAALADDLHEIVENPIEGLEPHTLESFEGIVLLPQALFEQLRRITSFVEEERQRVEVMRNVARGI